MRDTPLTRRLRVAVHDALGQLGLAAGWDPLGRGFRVRRLRRLGRDPLADVKRILGRAPRVVFDVGANTGQTALACLHAFPGAAIYSFEPDPRTFARLRDTLRRHPRATPVALALGDAEGEATLYRAAFDQMSSLLPAAAGAHQDPALLRAAGEITVPRTTVDRFRAEHATGPVDLLKIDAQGYELHVLRGAADSLERGEIGLVYLEVQFVPAYEGQPSFSALLDFLLRYGYRLVGLYETGFGQANHLVEANALFVDERLSAPRPR